MNLIDKLNSISINTQSLEKYLKDNFLIVYDFFSSQRYEDLIKNKKQFRQYIKDHHIALSELNFANKPNLSFLILLFEYSEMLGLLSEFRILHNILRNYPTIYGNRLQAASLFFLNQRNTNDIVNIYDEFLRKLSIACLEEEDNEDSVIATFINYYAQIVNNFGQFNQPFVMTIKDKIRNSINQGTHYFLRHKIIDDVLEINTNPFEKAYSKIKSTLDYFLKREYKKIVYQGGRCLIEKGTKYEELLQNVNPDFNSIRQISVEKFIVLPNNNSVFFSLQRGVKILMKEEELFAYMNSYSFMHYEKLTSAFEYLPKSIFDKKINIIDWGCGQGLGEIAYLDFLQKNNYTNNIKTITLIEPSEIALKRAALHSKKMDKGIEITTIHKDLDALLKDDLLHSYCNTTLHIFSNILDINSFSMSKLLVLLKDTLIGTNYFLCVSPSINDQKNARINGFVNSFSTEEVFTSIKSINNEKGKWLNSWSRILRLFKVERKIYS